MDHIKMEDLPGIIAEYQFVKEEGRKMNARFEAGMSPEAAGAELLTEHPDTDEELFNLIKLATVLAHMEGHMDRGEEGCIDDVRF